VTAVIWGTFVAPRAPMPAPGLLRLILELVVFGSAAGALYSAGRPTLAWALALVFGANRALTCVWGQ
jgi:hypothetical protein